MANKESSFLFLSLSLINGMSCSSLERISDFTRVLRRTTIITNIFSLFFESCREKKRGAKFAGNRNYFGGHNSMKPCGENNSRSHWFSDIAGEDLQITRIREELKQCVGYTEKSDGNRLFCVFLGTIWHDSDNFRGKTQLIEV